MSDKHEWQFRLVWREKKHWHASQHCLPNGIAPWLDTECSEVIVQRRRRRDHLDPAPCEGIEDPVWRDWIASDDPDIQGVLISKGMPFRSLEK